MSSPRNEHIEAVDRAIGEIVKTANPLAVLRARVMTMEGAVAHAVGDSQNHAALEARADLASIEPLLDNIHAILINAEESLGHYKAAI